MIRPPGISIEGHFIQDAWETRAIRVCVPITNVILMATGLVIMPFGLADMVIIIGREAVPTVFRKFTRSCCRGYHPMTYIIVFGGVPQQDSTGFQGKHFRPIP